MYFVFVPCILCSLVYHSNAACTWPDDFINSTWHDSDKGAATFLTTTVTGFAFTVQVQSGAPPVAITEWECVVFDEAESYLVMKTTSKFIQFVVNEYVAYKCLRLTKLTDVSYRYYQIDPIQSTLNYDRLNIQQNDTLSSVADTCSEINGASGSEYKVLVKSGFESGSRITCPYVILADYSYTYNASDSSVSCDPTTDVGQLDMCTNRSQFTFHYPACTSLTVYSNTDTVWCTDVVTVGGDMFVTLFNGLQDTATIDSSNTFQFSCIGINTDGTLASVTSQYCKQNQTPGQIPTDNEGSSVGAVLTLIRTGDLCPPCPTLANPLLGSVYISTDGAVTTATYTCDDGYTLSGDTTRTCQSNGTWSGSIPSCTCALPTAPSNGSVTSTDDGLTLTYSCDAGTVLNGETSRTCQTELNTWTGAAPTCDACGTLTQPTNGSYVITTTGLTSIVTYICDVGTSLNGDVNRTCQLDTMWGGAAPTCVACPSLSNPASGNVSIATDGVLSIATYACASGYYLEGLATSTCTGGVWNSGDPTCVCDVPVNPVNGTATVSADGYALTYTCDVGFTLSGQPYLICQTDGSGWGAALPTCAVCETLTSPTNGSLTLSSNGTLTKVSYSCDIGFSMSGDVTAMCSTTGAWSTSSPTCTQCETLPDLASGNIVFSTDSTTTSAQFTCDVGSSLHGDVTITCDSYGVWTSTSTNTSCVTCPSLTSATGGTFQVTSDGTTSSATLTCTSGYTLSGSAASTCLANGTWSSEQPYCAQDATDKDNSPSLLAVVIALAILTAILAAALVGALIYIYRQRKSQKNDANNISEYDTIPEPDSRYILGKLLDEASKPSAAPVGHQHHVFNTGSSSMGRAPSSHMSSASFWRDTATPGSITPPSVRSGPMSMPGSVTPRSAKSVASVGKMKLDLVKEATKSFLNLETDVPAPWTIHGNSTKQSPTSKAMRSPRGEKSPRRKKAEVHENSLIPKKGVAEDLKLDLSGVVDTPRLGVSNTLDGSSFNSSRDSKRTKRRRTRTPRRERSEVSVRDDAVRREATTVKNPNRSTERATTPVRHMLTVKDVETPRTPRTNQITTIQ